MINNTITNSRVRQEKKRKLWFWYDLVAESDCIFVHQMNSSDDLEKLRKQHGPKKM